MTSKVGCVSCGHLWYDIDIKFWFFAFHGTKMKVQCTVASLCSTVKIPFMYSSINFVPIRTLIATHSTIPSQTRSWRSLICTSCGTTPMISVDSFMADRSSAKSIGCIGTLDRSFPKTSEIKANQYYEFTPLTIGSITDLQRRNSVLAFHDEFMKRLNFIHSPQRLTFHSCLGSSFQHR